MTIVTPSFFSKSSVSKVFSVQMKTKARNSFCLKTLKAFSKSLFSRRIGVDGKSNPRNNAFYHRSLRF